MDLGYFVADRVEFFGLVHEDQVVLVGPHHRAIGGDDYDVQVVDLHEFRRLGIGRAGHAGNLLVKAEEVLEGDGRQGPVTPGYLDLLLGLDGLVKAVGISPSVEYSPGEFVDDLDESLLDDVIDVLLEEDVCLRGLGEVMDELEVPLVEDRALDEPPLQQELLDLVHALGSEGDALALLVDLVIPLEELALVLFGVFAGLGILLHLGELGHQAVDLVDLEGIVLGRARYDEGRTRLVDEYRVDFVDDAVVVPALDLAFGTPRHVVAQVIEAEFVVGSISDITGVLRSPDLVVHVRENDAHRKAEVAVHSSHPLRVALGEIVVDRDDMDSVAGEGVEIGRADRRQGLALARLHLDDLALVEDDAAEDLHVEGPLAENPPRRLAHEGEGLGQEPIEAFASLVSSLELLGLLGELFRTKRDRPGFLRVHLVKGGQERFYVALLFRAEKQGENVKTHDE